MRGGTTAPCPGAEPVDAEGQCQQYEDRELKDWIN
jgi:hypothetical protein